jgi:hypothetical protein
VPHCPTPFVKPNRNAWSVEVQRVQHSPDKHPDGSPPPKKRDGRWDPPREMLDEYHRVVARLQEQAGAGEPSAPTAPPTGAGVLDEFVGWLKGRLAGPWRHTRPFAFPSRARCRWAAGRHRPGREGSGQQRAVSYLQRPAGGPGCSPGPPARPKDKPTLDKAGRKGEGQQPQGGAPWAVRACLTAFPVRPRLPSLSRAE